MESELVPIEATALVRPVADLETISEAFQEYRRLSARLLESSDVQQISGKQFTKRSGWRKLATAYSVSFELLAESEVRDDQDRIVRAKVIMRAKAPNGRFADGIGICSYQERKDSKKPDHDVPAVAWTRAVNRAAADLFGLGEVSAEEISSETVRLDMDGLIGELEEGLRRIGRTSDQIAAAYGVKTLADMSYSQLEQAIARTHQIASELDVEAPMPETATTVITTGEPVPDPIGDVQAAMPSLERPVLVPPPVAKATPAQLAEIMAYRKELAMSRDEALALIGLPPVAEGERIELTQDQATALIVALAERGDR